MAPAVLLPTYNFIQFAIDKKKFQTVHWDRWKDNHFYQVCPLIRVDGNLI